MSKQMKGLLGEKLGMTQVFDENNRIVPVTVVQAGPCVVTQVRSVDTDGYAAVQIGFGAIDPRRVNKPDTGHFAKAERPPVMAEAMRHGTVAGRLAYLAGRMPKREDAQPSSPTEGVPTALVGATNGRS